ncbi:metallophosphoesterase [Hominifimenecus sp. rT4P-3]|uniref:metallophosphoesterase n=1 Tax=Hominifimenecus sp. rT4P-3 TaxID=3242979 RepID=UPI003DA2FED6
MRLRISRYLVDSEKIPEEMNGCRIAVLADLHDCEVGKKNSRLLAALRQEQPNCVLLAGDMVVENVKCCRARLAYRKAREFLIALAKEFPVYYGMGNHESRWKKNVDSHSMTFERFRQELEDEGIIFLDNRSVVLGNGDRGVRITGLELPLPYYQRKIRIPHLTGAAIRKLAGEADQQHFQILLAHSPQFFQGYGDWGADLALAGHFHGGMIRLPVAGGVISTYCRLFPKYDRGMFVKKNRRMIVSAGLGTHTIPLRINNPPELIFLELTHRG